MRRAARWDGVVANTLSADGSFSQPTTAEVRAMKLFIDEERARTGQTAPLEIIVEGVTPGDNADQAAEILVPMSDAGVTWWIESMWDSPGGMEAVLKRIRQGPPAIP
jgi:hypothetical protein